MKNLETGSKWYTNVRDKYIMMHSLRSISSPQNTSSKSYKQGLGEHILDGMLTLIRRKLPVYTDVVGRSARAAQICHVQSQRVVTLQHVTPQNPNYTSSPAVDVHELSGYTELRRSSADAVSASSHSTGDRRTYSEDFPPRTTSSVRTTSTMSVPGTSNMASSSIRSFTQTSH